MSGEVDDEHASSIEEEGEDEDDLNFIVKDNFSESDGS